MCKFLLHAGIGYQIVASKLCIVFKIFIPHNVIMEFTLKIDSVQAFIYFCVLYVKKLISLSNTHNAV